MHICVHRNQTSILVFCSSKARVHQGISINCGPIFSDTKIHQYGVILTCDLLEVACRT